MLQGRYERASESVITPNLVGTSYQKATSIDDLLDRLHLHASVPGTVDYLIDGQAFFRSRNGNPKRNQERGYQSLHL
jgi:hypothetical protein